MDELDRKLLSTLQEEFPAEARPFASVAARLKVSEDDVLARVERLKKDGVIRRIGAVFDQRALGYKSALAAVSLPSESLEQAAAYAASFREVTHCYSRRHPVNLWFTVTAPTDERIEQVRRSIQEFCGCPVRLLRARRTFKIRATFDV